MKTIFINLLLMIICASYAYADIAPNPIKAKGITTSEPTTISMVSERVIVDLYRDSSVVECYFNMKNEGKKQKVNIGFPEMYFHHWKGIDYSNFHHDFVVHDNGKEVSKVDFYVPKKNKDLGKSNLGGEEQPWYLWKSTFDEAGTKTIRVRYTLPNGQMYKSSRYFTYLLSTGSGWMGAIDTAEVIITLKDFSPDLMLKITPENYTIEGNRMYWRFLNLEPTANDDIKINYEPSKGYSTRKITPKPEPTIIVNDEIKHADGAIDSKGLLDSINPSEILAMRVLKELSETEKYTSDKNGVVLIYTRNYAIEKLKEIIKTKCQNNQLFDNVSYSDLIRNYEMRIAKTDFEGEELLIKVIDLKEDEIRDVTIKKKSLGKIRIDIIL